MARCLLPLAAVFFSCLTVLPASAAEKSSPLPDTSSERRVEVDTQRERITGADTLTNTTPSGEQTILEAPVDTTDAPSADKDN